MQLSKIEKQRVLEINKEALKLFVNSLNDENLGIRARDFLLKEQKLSLPIVERFQIGYAPENFNALYDRLINLNYTKEEIILSCLFEKDCIDGKICGCLSDRVILPVIDVCGNVVAFVGCAIGKAMPKYIVTADKHKDSLFGLNLAKEHCTNELILCEGFFDVIALHKIGFENTASTLGTALTSEQARIIAKCTNNVAICFDSDSCGQALAEQAHKSLKETGINVRIVKLTDAKDPSEFIEKYGKNSFSTLLQQ